MLISWLQSRFLARRGHKAKAHPIWIVMMWSFYLLIPLAALLQISQYKSMWPLMVYLSLVSFFVALWLVFQRSRADMLHGGLKLVLDLAAMIALIWMLLCSGALSHLLHISSLR